MSVGFSRGSSSSCPLPAPSPPPRGARCALFPRRHPGGGRGELVQDRLEAGVVEAGAYLGDVDEARGGGGAVVDAEMERAEVAARALGIRVAADHELLAALALDLDPVAGARA